MTDYEDFLYSDFPHLETHPDRLATLGTLFGLSPAPPGRCRVLELGCGLGGNLIGLAVALPDSTFVGIDRSPQQVAAGQETIDALGLANIRLRAQDILHFDDDGPFDYILCHGIYSWVPEPVQAAILSILRRCLAPQGIGYVSYNTLPGWHMRSMVRDLLRHHAGEGSHTERLGRARAFLSFLGHMPTQRSAAQAFLAGEVNLLDQLADEYLFYEHLVVDNRPQYFRDFAAAAKAAGLQYVGDAHPPSALQTRLGPEVLAAIPSEDVIEREQYLDYLDVRFFRRTLLCHGEQTVIRQPGPRQLERLFVSSLLQPVPVPEEQGMDPHGEESVAFRCSDDRGVSAHEPLLKAALWLLAERAPEGVPFSALCAAAWAWVSNEQPERAPDEAEAQLAQSLLDLLSRGFVLLGTGLPTHASVPGTRPETTALVRLQASRGKSGCFNLRHESVGVDPFDRALLRRLDGTRTSAELAAEVVADMQAGEYELQHAENDQPVSDPEELREIVEQRLRRLARAGLLLR